MKLRASYGRSGYDIYDYDMDKQYWIGSGSYYFQAGNTSAGSSLKEGMLAMEQLDLEVADKYNIGLDMSLLKGLTFSIDGFYDKRSNILIEGSGLISSAIGVTIPQMNAGKVETKGTELSTMWKKEYKNFSYYIGANFSYAKSKVIENGEGINRMAICLRKVILSDNVSVGKRSVILEMRRTLRTALYRNSRRYVRGMSNIGI